MSNKINQENADKRFWMVWNPETSHTHTKNIIHLQMQSMKRVMELRKQNERN